MVVLLFVGVVVGVGFGFGGVVGFVVCGVGFWGVSDSYVGVWLVCGVFLRLADDRKYIFFERYRKGVF